MVKKTLSSIGTFFFKYGFTTIWIGLSVLFAFVDFRSNRDNRELDFTFFFIISIIVTPFLLLTFGSLKKVTLDGSELVISNYLKKIRVPLSQVENVWESSFLRPKLISITFKAPTAFGRKIRFLPVTTLKDFILSSFCSHSIVKELSELSETYSSCSDS